MLVLYFFSIIVLLKFLLNTFRLIATLFCYHKFLKQPKNLAQYIPLTESMFDSAVTNKIVYLHTWNTDEYTKLSNLLCDKDQHKHLDLAFNQTIGTYKMRMWQCINPFYWLLLPKYIFSSFNITPPKIVLSLSNILYWIISVTAGYFLEAYLESHFQALFQQVIDKLP